MDYSNSKAIATEIGLSKLVIGDFKILHVIKLGQYENLLASLEETVRRDISKKDNDFNYLMYEINQQRKALNELRPRRSTRSINVIGTALKWIAGTPDHDDFQILSDYTENLIRNNNNQMVINRAIEERLQVITNRTNMILNSIKTTTELKTELVRNIELKLRIVREELRNVNYAIQWAKGGIINSFVLSDSELAEIREFFSNQNLPYLNIIEALEFGEVKIGSGEAELIFILSLPKTEDFICKKLFVRPVRKGEGTIKIKGENFILCGESVLEVKNSCKVFNDMSLCKRENVRNITDTRCLPNLLSGLPSFCPTTNHHHIPLVEQIASGLILLNGYSGLITMENEQLTLNGTFLVKFHNTSITIGDTVYFNKHITMARPLPAIVQSPNVITSYEEILSLESLKDLHFHNLDEIRAFARKGQITIFSSLGFVGILILVFLGVTIKRLISKKGVLQIEKVVIHPSDSNNIDPSNMEVGI